MESIHSLQSLSVMMQPSIDFFSSFSDEDSSLWRLNLWVLKFNKTRAFLFPTPQVYDLRDERMHHNGEIISTEPDQRRPGVEFPGKLPCQRIIICILDQPPNPEYTAPIENVTIHYKSCGGCDRPLETLIMPKLSDTRKRSNTTLKIIMAATLLKKSQDTT